MTHVWFQEIRYKFGEFTVSVAAAIAGVISLATGINVVTGYQALPHSIVLAYEVGIAAGGIALLFGLILSALRLEAFGYLMLAASVGFLGILRCMHFLHGPAGAVFFVLIGIWMLNRFLITTTAISVLEKRHHA